MPYLEPLWSQFFPIFSKWRIRFNKYPAVGMTCATWLSFPINNSSVSVLIFVEANAYFMSLTQDVCFSSVRNTLREWVFMSHPRHVLWLVSCPSPISFLKESGSSHFRGYDGCSGRNSVWMTNRAALFALSIQCYSLTIMVMMSSMNPYIDEYVAVMSTANGSAVTIWLAEFCLFTCRSKDQYGYFR